MEDVSGGASIDLQVHAITDELLGEFGDRVGAEEVERTVREAARTLHETRIQAFVPILIRRDSRERLRRISGPRPA